VSRRALAAAEPIGGRRPVFYGWWMVATAVLVQAFAVGFTQYAFPLFLKPVAEEFGASRSRVSLGYSGLSVAMAALGPFLGPALDRRSLRAILCAGALAMAAGFALIAATPELLLIGLVFAVVVGPGALAAGPLGASKLVANWFLRRRGLALGISATGTSIGGFLCPPLLTLAIARFGWRGAALAMAASLVGIAVPILALAVVGHPEERGLAPDGDPPEPGDASRSAAAGHAQPGSLSLLRDRNFLAITLSIGSVFAILAGLLTNLHAYATDLGIAAERASLLFSTLSACGIVGKLGFGAIADRWSKRALVWGAMAMLALFLGVLLVRPGFRGLVLASGFAGLALGGFLPLWGALIGDCFGRESFGRVMGLMGPLMLPLNVGAIQLAPWCFDRTGSYDLALQVFLGWVAVGAAALGLVRLPARDAAAHASSASAASRAQR
jgi:predicted MFS family arabinose efflux permease